jgi:hypothetical protein
LALHGHDHNWLTIVEFVENCVTDRSPWLFEDEWLKAYGTDAANLLQRMDSVGCAVVVVIPVNNVGEDSAYFVAAIAEALKRGKAPFQSHLTGGTPGIA